MYFKSFVSMSALIVDAFCSQVAAAKETKMNLSNLAKILGPTIIGYSSVEALPEDIMKEVRSSF